MRSSPMPVSIDGAGSGLSVAVRLPVELHEHVVPDLDVAVAAALDAAADRLRARQMIAAEVVDLRAAAARAGVAHLPEVVVGAELRRGDRSDTYFSQCSYASSSRGMPASP